MGLPREPPLCCDWCLGGLFHSKILLPLLCGQWGLSCVYPCEKELPGAPWSGGLGGDQHPMTLHALAGFVVPSLQVQLRRGIH